MRALAGLFLVALLGACSTNTVELPYAATRPATAAAGLRVALGPVTDARTDNDRTWVGAVRGGYGNPLKVLRTGPPVADVVRAALADGLRQRGWLAEGAASPAIAVTIRQLSVSRYVRLDANVELVLEVRDPGGTPVYTDTATVERVQGNILALDTGVFASSEELRVLLARSLSEALDQLLDKPGLQAALRSGPARVA